MRIALKTLSYQPQSSSVRQTPHADFAVHEMPLVAHNYARVRENDGTYAQISIASYVDNAKSNLLHQACCRIERSLAMSMDSLHILPTGHCTIDSVNCCPATSLLVVC